MDAADIKQLIEDGIDGAEAQVSGGGDRFDITVIADHFDGLTPVRRQQAIYACINHLISDGSIHAVNLQTFTQAQWQQANPNG